MATFVRSTDFAFMTLAEILSNEPLRQHEFPVAKDKIFLAHAGVCALPRRVAQAICECANGAMLGDQEEFVMHRIAEARAAGGRLGPGGGGVRE